MYSNNSAFCSPGLGGRVGLGAVGEDLLSSGEQVLFAILDKNGVNAD